jgi:hypothetical protein
MVSSLEDVSILRIMGREGTEAAAAAAAFEAVLLETGIRGEKLPGALGWGRGCCIVSTERNLET